MGHREATIQEPNVPIRPDEEAVGRTLINRPGKDLLTEETRYLRTLQVIDNVDYRR